MRFLSINTEHCEIGNVRDIKGERVSCQTLPPVNQALTVGSGGARRGSNQNPEKFQQAGKKSDYKKL